jgi:hypothetical protein
MKRHAITVLSGALFIGLFSVSSAAAQDTTKVKPDTVRKEAKGEVAAPAAAPSFSTLLAAVNAAAANSAKIETLADLKAEQIRLVDAKTLTSDGSDQDLAAALEANKDALASLQSALQKNQLISKAIADHPAKPAITDVVAADVADGSLTIYFRQKTN